MDEYLINKIKKYADNSHQKQILRLFETSADYRINFDKETMPFSLNFGSLVSFYDKDVVEKQLKKYNKENGEHEYEGAWDYNDWNFYVKNIDEFRNKYPNTYHITHKKKLTKKLILIIDVDKDDTTSSLLPIESIRMSGRQRDVVMISHHDKKGYTFEDIGKILIKELEKLRKLYIYSDLDELHDEIWEISVTPGYDGTMIIETIT